MPANLIDLKPIGAYLDRFLPDEPEAQRLLRLALTKPLARRNENLEELQTLPADAPVWLTKKWPEGGPYHGFHPDRALDDKVRHIADWIAVAVADGEPWLRQLSHGRPSRFTSINTLEDAYAEADKDMRQRNRKFVKALTPDGEGENTVMALDNGFHFVQLLTSSAMDREGVRMGHCIGQGAYDQLLRNGSRAFFSLRDAAGEPHATLEVDTRENALLQCQGKENKPPVARYLPHLARFIEQHRYRLQVPACDTGLVESEGRYYSIFHLPKGLSVGGNLDLSLTAITSLPQGLKVGGHLDLVNTPITSLPAGLNVGGYLDLGDTPITFLPEGLRVGGYLNLRNTPITSLPAGLTVGGNLDLHNTPMTSLPEGLNVGGYLNLSKTPITSLPQGLTVGGGLNLRNTPINSLPEGLRVGGNLDLGNTPITSLPAGLNVGGDLYLNARGDLYLTGTQVSEIPPDARIGGKIFGLPKGVADKHAQRKDHNGRIR